MAVPKSAHYKKALDRGDTLKKRPHIGFTVRRPRGSSGRSPSSALECLRSNSPTMQYLYPISQDIAQQKTVVLLGHERRGVPDEIPMIGRGASLNVGVAGSLVLYRLAGLS